MHIEEGTYGTLSQKRSSYLFCIYKKECVLVMFINFGKDMTGKLRKKMQKHVFWDYFHTWEIRAWDVVWKSFYEDDNPQLET